MVKNLFLYQVMPFLTAVLLVGLCICLLQQINPKKTAIKKQVQHISGIQKKHRGFIPNLQKGEQAEIDFVSSIANPEQLTIFGSSEFSGSPFCSFNFLPDSLGIMTMGIGHAYHQSFSVLCELLSVDEWVENSKINIIVSPGWFETEGTNSEAFTEFVSPTILKQIWLNPNISKEYKIEIGRYIHKKKHGFEGSLYVYDLFENLYVTSNNGIASMFSPSVLRSKIQSLFPNSYKLDSIFYEFQLTSTQNINSWKGNYDEMSKKKTDLFLGDISTNQIFVNDHYYETYLLKDGEEKHGSIKKYELSKNQEFKDFKLMIRYLASKKADVSIVIQPLNPYYYDGVENHSPLIDSVCSILKQFQIPTLNMYANSKQEYEPGILNDVMHLGDPGWLKINAFLDSLYQQKHENI